MKVAVPIARHGSALASADVKARRSAALALARLGRGASPASEALARSLSDTDDDVRFRAAFALKVLGFIESQSEADMVIGAIAPVLTQIDALEPFTSNSIVTRGIVNGDTWMTGEFLTDASGYHFMAPEEDYRGGGMGSIRLYGQVSCDQSVKITEGVYDADIGIWVGSYESI